jgi:small conductance mechanosensitive channel
MLHYLNEAFNEQFALLVLMKGLRICFVIIVAYVLYNIVKHILARVIGLRFEKLSGSQQRRTNTLLSLTHSILAVIFIFMTIMMVLNELSIDTTSLLAGVSIIGVAIGVGAQGLIKDFVSGLFIILENQYAIGDIVTVKGFTGTVTDVSLRMTKICSADQVVHSIPNGMIDIVSNYTKSLYNATVRISISQSADPDVVLPILQRALDTISKRDDVQGDGASVGGIVSMEGTSLVYEVIIPTRRGDAYSVSTAYRYEAAKLLRQADVTVAAFAVETNFPLKKEA